MKMKISENGKKRKRMSGKIISLEYEEKFEKFYCNVKILVR